VRSILARVRKSGTAPAIASCLVTVFITVVVALTAFTHAATDFERVALLVLPGAGILIAIFGFYIFRGGPEEPAPLASRAVLEALQLAVSDRESLPRELVLGAAYVVASDGPAGGGDLFDVHRIDDSRGYVLIADASGKGLDAALDAAFVKFAVRALIGQLGTADGVLSALNGLYADAHPRSEAFASVFLGIFDLRRATLSYVSAGHAEAWLRRGAQVSSLPYTGPVIGLFRNARFSSRAVAFEPDDLLVIATNGLTQAPTPGGERLSGENAAVWIARAASSDPQAVVDELAERVRRYSGGVAHDDLAILALRNAAQRASGPAGSSGRRPTYQPTLR